MIKMPIWCLEHVAELGQRVIDDELSAVDAAEELAAQIRKKDQPLMMQILTEWSRNRLRTWTYQKIRDQYDNEARSEAGQDMLPFPDLPAKLEVRPGVEMHQKVMTGKDWDNALAIWRNRADQAKISYDRFKRRYDQIRPLLNDGDTTTGDVIDQLG